MKKKPSMLIMVFLVLLLAVLFSPAVSAEEKLEALSNYGNPLTTVTIGQVQVKAEVVWTPEKLYLGLGKRPDLPEGQGMLFVMPRWEIQDFCMRDMRFPIDFIWIGLGKVAGLTKNVSARDQQACYRSPEAVNYVLEVPAGFCDRFGIKAGDAASW